MLPKHKPEISLPLCAFVIDVRKNVGYYTWIIEPAIESGNAKLLWNGESGWKNLDEAAVHALVDKVNRWYDLMPVAANATA